MADLNISYDPNGGGLIKGQTLQENFQRRIVDAYENIPSLSTNNNPFLSVNSKAYYFKELGDNLNTITVEHLGMNNLWFNELNCSLIQI